MSVSFCTIDQTSQRFLTTMAQTAIFHPQILSPEFLWAKIIIGPRECLLMTLQFNHLGFFHPIVMSNCFFWHSFDMWKWSTLMLFRFWNSNFCCGALLSIKSISWQFRHYIWIDGDVNSIAKHFPMKSICQITGRYFAISFDMNVF